MTDLETLIAARAVIERPENWCQGYAAMTSGGRPAFADNPKAVRFCALGAIGRVLGRGIGLRTDPGVLALVAACPCAPDYSVAIVAPFNNTHTHPEVLALFDRAIATERAKLRQSHIDKLKRLPALGCQDEPALSI